MLIVYFDKYYHVCFYILTIAWIIFKVGYNYFSIFQYYYKYVLKFRNFMKTLKFLKKNWKFYHF